MRSHEAEPAKSQLRRGTISYARRRLPIDLTAIGAALYITASSLLQENSSQRHLAARLRRQQTEKAHQATDIYPGYFESKQNLDTPFFTLQHGHLEWLSQVNKLQPIQAIGESALKAMHAQGEIARLGDLVQLYIEHTHTQLLNYTHQKFSNSQLPADLDTALNSPTYADTIIYYAALALGGTVTPYISDLSQYNFPPYTFSKNHWDPHNGFMRIFPGIFPAAGNKQGIEYAGKDRTAHAMSHLAFVHILNKSQQYSLPYHHQFPVGLSAVKTSFDVLVPGFENQRMSILVGLGWELRNTPNYLKQYLRGEPIMDGLLDPEVDFDISGGNALGGLVGNYLKRVDAAKIKTLRFLLNSDELHQPQDKPRISEKLLDALARY